MRIGLSPLDAARCDVVADLPAHSPVTHGMLRIEAEVEDGVIVSARPVLGGMHRGAEKLFESRDYRQVITLANRHEWLASFAGEFGAAHIIERALGIEAPEHAAWLRTLLLEVHRVASHLAFIGGHPQLEATPARRLREDWLELLQEFTGTRMHSMVSVIGGVSREPGAQWLSRIEQAARDAAGKAEAIATAAHAIVPGIGVVDADAVSLTAISGPVARAAGVDIDIRDQSTALRYPSLGAYRRVTGNGGDVRARMVQLAAELAVALECVAESAQRCLELAGSPANVALPKVVRVPVGEYTCSIETPMGIAHWLLVSRGDKMPHRLALRPASLHTVLALEIALRGARLEDVGSIVASMPFVTGDAER